MTLVSDYTPYETMDVLIYPWPNLGNSMSVKWFSAM